MTKFYKNTGPSSTTETAKFRFHVMETQDHVHYQCRYYLVGLRLVLP